MTNGKRNRLTDILTGIRTERQRNRDRKVDKKSASVFLMGRKAILSTTAVTNTEIQQ